MTPTKLLIGQILVVFAIVLAGIWFATQWAAAKLVYQPELGTPWANREAYDRVSYPFLHADRIATPTQFYCAEKDSNVPCHGAEQMYQALRSRGVPTQLIVYPGESHAMAVPSYLRDRLERALAWYARYLNP